MAKSLKNSKKSTQNKKLGRPEVFSKKVADKICEIISTSAKSMRTIANEVKIGQSTIWTWLSSKDPKFAFFQENYARAKELQADYLAEEILEIADDARNDFMTITMGRTEIEVENKEVTNRSKLRVDARKWVASKLKPKKYGDKIDHTTGGNPLPAANILNLPTDKLQALEEILNSANGDQGGN